MKKFNSFIYVICSTLILYTSSAYANLIWPAAVIGGAIFPYNLINIIVVLVSIIIEAGLYLYYIKDTSYFKALAMSFVGNLASTVIGLYIMVFVMVIWDLIFHLLLGGEETFYPLSTALRTILISIEAVGNIVLMYLGTVLIEMYTIKFFFKYSYRSLLAPVFIGNFITYVLAAIAFICQNFEEIYTYYLK